MPPRSRPSGRDFRRKTEAGELVAERILRAALEVFASRGLHGARLDQIATAAGIPKPNLLYYFPNKEELYRAVLRRTMDVWLKPLRELDPARDAQGAIGGFIDASMDFARDRALVSRLFAMEILQGGSHLKAVAEGAVEELIAAKSRTIDGWMRAGSLRSTDPRDFMLALWALTQNLASFPPPGRALVGRAFEAGGPAVSDREALREILLRGILPPDLRIDEQKLSSSATPTRGDTAPAAAAVTRGRATCSSRAARSSGPCPSRSEADRPRSSRASEA